MNSFKPMCLVSILMVALVASLTSAVPVAQEAEATSSGANKAENKTLPTTPPTADLSPNDKPEVRYDFVEKEFDAIFNDLYALNGKKESDFVEQNDALIDHDSGIHPARASTAEPTTRPTTQKQTQKMDREDSVSEVGMENASKLDGAIVQLAVIAGASAAGLLIVLLILVLTYMKCRSLRKSKDTCLNSDLKRWDPQILRPNQKSIDSFIYGTPIPSISEMIKQEES